MYNIRRGKIKRGKERKGRRKNKGIYYLTFFLVFVIAFVLFSIVFLSVLSAFPDRPRVQGLFESIVELDIPLLKAFVITGRQISGQAILCTNGLANCAASLAPGEWAELTTNNINPTLDADGSSGFVFGYAESMKWDPVSRKLFYAGGDHGLAYNIYWFVIYDEATNTWSRNKPPWAPPGLLHGYDNSGLDFTRGYFYTRVSESSRVWQRYNISTQTWTPLPANDLYAYAGCCGGVDYFPEMDALVAVPGSGGIYRFKESLGQWEIIQEGLGLSTGWQFAEYNPIHKVVVFGKSGTHYKLVADGSITQLNPPAVNVYDGSGWNGVFSVDPVSGDYIVLTAGFSKSRYIYDVTTDTWTSTSPPPFTDGAVVAAPIGTYGVIAYVTCRGGSGSLPDCRMYLYKHSPSSDTIPPLRSNGAPSGTLAAGTTSATLSLNTNEGATCRYSTTSGVGYGSMTNVFSTTGGTSHSTSVSGLQNGQSYNYYVKCQDGNGNANTNDFAISFSVAAIQSINLSIQEPSGASRTNGHISSGIPLPPGSSPNEWSLWDGGTEIPVQITQLP
ncbi:hypothetical protein HYV49_02625, partial [Candidatus Pacearchaeota archaeon]|nr:hypothetical protein [Candidatus Pacearchaeota archaeon]